MNHPVSKMKFRIGTNPREIYDLLKSSPSGFTSHQIAIIRRMKVHAVQDAITDLKSAGYVVPTDETREEYAGGKGVVYRVAM